MHIIFDFDGTIVDSFDYVLGFLSREAGRKKPTGNAALEYRSMSMKNMALALGIKYWRLPLLYFKGRRVMRAHMKNLHSFPGMHEVIEQLAVEGNKLYIVSSNSGRNIRRFLVRDGLAQHFQAVWGGAGLFGKDNLIRSMRGRYRFKGDVWYIGDEMTDIRAAKVAKVHIAAVTWGFASHEELASKEPDMLIFTPNELLQIGKTS